MISSQNAIVGVVSVLSQNLLMAVFIAAREFILWYFFLCTLHIFFLLRHKTVLSLYDMEVPAGSVSFVLLYPTLETVLTCPLHLSLRSPLRKGEKYASLFSCKKKKGKKKKKKKWMVAACEPELAQTFALNWYFSHYSLRSRKHEKNCHRNYHRNKTFSENVGGPARWLRVQRQLPPRLIIYICSLGPTWSKERTDSCKLCSGHDTHAIVQSHHTDTDSHIFSVSPSLPLSLTHNSLTHTHINKG